MDFSAIEWLNLIVRWVHVFAAILWVGTTYYFTWLDRQLRRASSGSSPRVWMVHSGGFYTVEKQPTLGVAPSGVHWFRWEAMTTWLSGLTLLALVFYAGGLMVDPIAGRVSNAVAIVIGVVTLFGGWIVYDLLVRAIGGREALFATLAFAALVVLMGALSQVFSARATYIHIGALFGTIMALNVWDRILPSQRRMIAAAARGESIDPALGASAKHRSKHNTFLAVPTTFIMISSHFPTITYGHTHSLIVLAVVILIGWAAAAVLRRA